MKYILISLALCLPCIGVHAKELPTITDKILSNPEIEEAWFSKGPCNFKVSFTKKQTRSSGRDVSAYKLDCTALISMKYANGRISFMYILSNGSSIGFGSDGIEHKDEHGVYVEVDHFYPYSDTPWSAVNKVVDGNGMISENIVGKCYYGPHKVTKQNVVVCASAYFPSEENAYFYFWSVEITEEHIEFIKKKQEVNGSSASGPMYNTSDNNILEIRKVVGKCDVDESFVAVAINGHV